MKYLVIVLFLIVSLATNAQNLNFNKGRSVKKNYYSEQTLKIHNLIVRKLYRFQQRIL